MKTDFIYNQLAWLYDIPFGLTLREGHEIAAKEIQAQQARCQNGFKVAELGVGPGHSLEFYPDGTELTGIDLSEAMVKKASERLTALPQLTGEIRVMDATETDLKDNSFDLVTSFSVVTVVNQPEKLIKEAVRICKPGGRILIVGRMKRRGVVDLVFRNLTDQLTQVTLGFGTKLDQKIYDTVAGQVKFIARKPVNHMGPFFSLSDMMILEKLPNLL